MSFSVAVAGASGYAGGELLRLLADPPRLEVQTLTAFQNAGERLRQVHPHLTSYADRTFVETTAERLAGHDVVFLALPHGKSGAITAELDDQTLVVDCGADHRLSTRPRGTRSTAATSRAPGRTACPSCCTRRRAAPSARACRA